MSEMELTALIFLIAFLVMFAMFVIQNTELRKTTRLLKETSQGWDRALKGWQKAIDIAKESQKTTDKALGLINRIR